jgi:hypothetical protein
MRNNYQLFPVINKFIPIYQTQNLSMKISDIIYSILHKTLNWILNENKRNDYFSSEYIDKTDNP